MYWQEGHATDNRGYYPPDCYLPMTFKDYVSCSDPVLDAIKNGTALSLKQVLSEKGADAFLSEIDRRTGLYGDAKNWFPYTAFDLVLSAYFDLAVNGKTDDALKVLKWNAEFYPKDYASWYGLAEGAKEMEKTKESMDAYQRLFAVEPDIWETVGGYAWVRLLDAYESQGTGALPDVIEEMNKRNPFSVTERMLNDLGYRVLGKDKFQDAIQIFMLNVERHPESANAYDSLGEAYLKAGQNESARKNYEKSLELNPGNADAKKALEELGKK
jgi:tetratricopeptide (TPR) repeat protein